MRIQATLLAAFVLFSIAPGLGQEDLRVHVLYTGDPYPGQTPYIHMKVEPMLSVTPVQASTGHYAGISQKDIVRATRIYMPRTYDSLIQEYDVVIISDSNVGSFTAEQRRWFAESVGRDGLGLLMIGGYEAFGSVAGNPDWGATPVGEVLPVETFPGEYEAGRVTIVDSEHEFIRSLPWRPDLPFLLSYHSNLVKLKDGAQLLAVSGIEGGPFGGYENPFFSAWGHGQGRTFAMTGDWTPGGGWLLLQWEYLPDFATNLMLFLAQRSIPEDLDLVHTVRTRLATMGYRKIIIDSLIDFVEKFGANPRRIIDVLAEFDEVRGNAARLYLEQDFVAAQDTADQALSLMDEAELVAEKVKNEALLWVYVTEYMTVCATALIVGFAVWSLMVRRRLYRQVRTTSFR